MPEMKRNFTGGKMNKDLDERLVPNGEYRHAMNIQVSTSEESDVGTVRNILGNTPGCNYNDPNHNPVPSGSTTVGSIADEKNDSLYWLVKGSGDIGFLKDSLAVDQEASLKDIIMRTNSDVPSGCEPVMVDKYGWCVGINDNSIPANFILLNNPEWYSNVSIGMNVDGYNQGIHTFGPTLVTNDQGTLVTLPDLNYQVETNEQSVTPPPFQINNEILIRTFNRHGCCGGCQSHDYTDLQPCNQNVNQTNLPGPGQYQFWVSESDWINEKTGITVGATLTNVFNSVTGASILAGPGSTATVVDLTYQMLCSNLQPGQQTGCVMAYVLTIEIDVGGIWEPSLDQNPNTYGLGENHSYKNFNCTVTPAAQLTTIPSEVITATNQYGSGILPQMYDVLYDGPAQSNPTGAQLRIDNSYGSGNIWPPNSCIDPTSVEPEAPPPAWPGQPDNSFRVIDCDTGNLNIALSIAPVQAPIRFETLNMQYGQEAVFLHSQVDLSTSDTICFTSDKVLEFSSESPITGINIVDDMLFWTDNFSEPKKINISRSVQGTDILGDTQTQVIRENTTTGTTITKEHITVIKKGPKSALSLDLKSNRDPDKNYSGIITVASPTNPEASTFWDQRTTANANYPYDFSSITTENGSDIFRTIIKSDLSENTDFNLQDWKVGSKVVLKEFDTDGTAPSIPISDYTIKGTIIEWRWQGNDVNEFTSSQFDIDAGLSWGAKVAIKVDSMSRSPLNAVIGGTLDYAIDLFNESEKLFEFKLPRFSYRYKYEDGEYSIFAPWTRPAFLPGSFDYHPKQGYNLGMTNTLTHLYLRDFVTEDLPLDVVEIDLLYKEEVSPNIYVVETIRRDSEATITDADGNIWNNWSRNEFLIDRDNIKGVLPSNQLLRAWDTVPKTALAQEITGNRIIYGNYTQNYDLQVGGVRYNPNFNNCGPINTDDGSVTSIKSLRDYQLGVVFTDKYGRETPVISNNTGSFKIGKDQSGNSNKLQLNISNDHVPPNMEYYKFYIKETSGEYYNMAMDRYWDAEDGNVWISFSSNDRNKIDIDSVLILKKGLDSNSAVLEPGRFKVVAIENEAPDFIKINKTIISDVDHKANNSSPSFGADSVNGQEEKHVFSVDKMPKVGEEEFVIRYFNGDNDAQIYSNSAIKNLHKQSKDEGDIYFQMSNEARTRSSKPVKVAKIDITDDNWNNTDGSGTFTNDLVKWEIRLEEPFDKDINKFTNDASGNNSTYIKNGTRAIFWNYKKENLAEFDGRFFVKIYKDNTFEEHVVSNSVTAIGNYNDVIVQKIYSFNKNKHAKAWDNTAGVDFPNGDDSYIVTNINQNTPQWGDYITATSNLVNSYGGASDTDWKAHAAFFRGINVHKGKIGASVQADAYDLLDFGAHGINYRKNFNTMDLHMEEDGSEWDFEDVWFIDNETSAGQASQGIWGANFNDTDYPGIGFDADTKRMELAFGGIQPETYTQHHFSRDGSGVIQTTNPGFDWGFGQNGKDDYIPGGDQTFFDLSKNDYYFIANTLAEKLGPGKFFRWKDDPTQQLFRVSNASNYSLFRHDDAQDGPPGDSVRIQNVVARGLANIPPHHQWGNIVNGVSYITSTLFRPDNYSKNYRLTFTDHLDPTADVKWNPYSIGEIDKGLHMTLSTSAANGGTPREITVTSLIGTDASGLGYGDRSVEVGMVITSIDGNATEAIISKIEGNTLYLKHYDPNDLATEFPTANAANDTIVVKQYGMNGLSRNSAKNINYFNEGVGFNDTNPGVDAVGYDIEIVEPEITETSFPRFPAIFETEPKDNTDLDIYYEITDNIPTSLNSNNIQSILPVFTSFDIQAVDSEVGNNGFMKDAGEIIYHHPDGRTVVVSTDLTSFNIVNGDKMIITKPSGDTVSIEIINQISTANNTFGFSQSPLRSIFILRQNLTRQTIISTWHNCYSFGNGVESNRIRDTFNQAYIANGVKASTTLSEQYKEEHRKYGLVYSGLYNSTSSINNLNQFIAAEKITKEVNPTYGTIQKLHSRDSDLITLCEDKVLKILANKDALYNADGSPNLVASENVLGQTIPFVGEYGISKNPQSFASEAYRAYFTDKVRGKVVRLSKDGLTPISDHGMKSWFRENLKLSNTLIGSYDDRNDEYNITLKGNAINKTVTFKENVRGWVSFKSFIPEQGISCASEYYTFKEGELWRHHDKAVDRNNFYNTPGFTSLKVILNDSPSVVKAFYTLGYEGSQSKVDQLLTYNTYDPTSWDGTKNLAGDLNYTTVVASYDDNDHYNLQGKVGWYVANIKTNKEEGSLNEFIEKEGKWFNYIKGVNNGI